MDSEENTSIQYLLTSVTISLEEADEVMDRPTSANVMTYRGDNAEVNMARSPDSVMLKIREEGAEALLKETLLEEEEEQDAALFPSPDLPSLHQEEPDGLGPVQTQHAGRDSRTDPG